MSAVVATSPASKSKRGKLPRHKAKLSEPHLKFVIEIQYNLVQPQEIDDIKLVSIYTLTKWQIQKL